MWLCQSPTGGGYHAGVPSVLTHWLCWVLLQCHHAAQHPASCQPLLTLPPLPDAQPACGSPQQKVTENSPDSLCSEPPEQPSPTPFSASFPTDEGLSVTGPMPGMDGFPRQRCLSQQSVAAACTCSLQSELHDQHKKS